ncbi:MAG: DUF3137 domain-containing protein [Lachnospiraceae bacterium]|nr:DUF3137 domain-containing protein [Lachnospiraceae bacterium]
MQEDIQYMDSLRKKASQGMLIIIPLIFLAFISVYINPILFIGVIVAIVVVYKKKVSKNRKEYRAYYKDVFVKKMILQAIPDAVYEPNQGFERSMISGTGLMSMGNVYASEDYIRGTFNGVSFERADVVIEDESTDSEGHTTTTTYLRGRWMVFESNKTFQGDLQIVQKGFNFANKRKGLFTRKADRRHVFKTEDELFNKEFQCLCQDEAEAFYLLTPGVMQGLMRLAQAMDGKIMVGFVDNRMHVAVNSKKDSLEPPWRTITDADINEVTREINAITSFVVSMNLDRKIFL